MGMWSGWYSKNAGKEKKFGQRQICFKKQIKR
jgi:hypothetical protein